MPDRIPWRTCEQQARDTLKQLLIEAIITPTHIINCLKPFTSLIDACEYAVGEILVQTVPNNTEQPVTFASCKLTPS